MKKLFLLFSIFSVLSWSWHGFAASTQVETPVQPSTTTEQKPYPATIDLDEKNEQGWFIGSDQGVLFFVGNGDNLFGPQYYFTIFGGYNFKGWFQPMVRIAQAIGGTNTFFSTSTFFFMMEGGLRFTPIRTKVRPYFFGTAGFYVLSFDDFGFPVFSDTNFTYDTGGGIEVKFGPSRIGVGAGYRGFVNSGMNLHSVEVTLGYTFQF